MSIPHRRTCAHRDIHIRELDFHLYEWPGHTAPLILLHGWGDSGATFQFVVDHLASDRTCIAPDLRGFGRSQWAPQGYPFYEYLADLDALLDALSPADPVDLVGHSMGANIAMLYAGIRPERVRRLINLEGFGLPDADPNAAPARYREWLEHVRAGPRPYAEHESFARFEWFLSKRNPRTSPERIAFIARAWAQERDGRVVVRADPRHKWPNPVLYRRAEALACWREITAEVLLVCGGQSQLARRANAATDFEQLRASLRHARVEHLPDAGHMLHHEEPEKIARLIEDFLHA
jgi:pimeloyl-ACP methyl ester carboxylesterase